MVQSPGPFTVFAPTDAAFEQLGNAVVQDLLANVTALTNILTYHVIPDKIITSTQLNAGDIVTLQGETVNVSFRGYWFFAYPILNRNVHIVGYDILASNGIIHVIADVLIPPSSSPPQPTIFEQSKDTPDLSTLVTALELTGLNESLNDQAVGPLTLFAPTNQAFEDLGQEAVNALLQDPPRLANILQYHVVGAKLLRQDLESGVLTALNGGLIDVAIRPFWFLRRYFLNNDSRLLSFDNEATNGVVHLINKVLIPPGDIVTVAETAGFNSLVAALNATNLVGALQGDGPFTVFAPTDEAFSALGSEALDALFASPERLAQILLYHVVSGVVSSSALVEGEVNTLQNENITIGRDCGMLGMVCGPFFLNDGVGLVQTDVIAFNGVIHVIDEVLIPPSLQEAPGDIVAVAESAGFNSLVAALNATNLVGPLQGEGPFTVFAPTDEAFNLLGSDTLEALFASPEQLSQILLYHVVSGRILSTDLAEGMVNTLQNENITIGRDCTDPMMCGPFFLNDGVGLVQTDVIASNGVIHIIDTVLIPPSFQEEPGDIVAVAESAGFNNLVAALTATNLVGALQGEGPFTVFAPTDEAFNLLGSDTLEALFASPDQLSQILLYHVVSGRVLSTDLAEGMVNTLQNENITIGRDCTDAMMCGPFFLNDGVHFVQTDVIASNGVIHIIDTVLIPPSLQGIH